MPLVDQFESVFRAAVKEQFVYQKQQLSSILIICDLPQEGADAFANQVRAFLKVLGVDGLSSMVISGESFETTEELLAQIEGKNPDLICTYRNLHSSGWKFPHSLGEHLDVLTQKTSTPVLVVPHPLRTEVYNKAMKECRQVMAVTDHLTSDHDLINYAARFTASGGTLYLCHIEDQLNFDRMMAAISKIPTINTDDALRRIKHQLIKEPREYIESCRVELSAHLDLRVESIVDFGHHMLEYRKYIDRHEIDLLVMHTKDDDQLAMHGLAYPLAVELRHIPLLML